MILQFTGKTLHLTYSTNVHPSEDMVQLHRFLKESVIPLKERLAQKQEFGLGLYLPKSVVDALSQNEYARWELDEFFKKHGLYVFTLNCFPFGNFHTERVKEKVFEPDWTTADRLDYTKKAADLLARWLPEGVKGSISTHTGAYGHRSPKDPIWEKIAENLVKCALHLSRLEEKTGKRIMLSLEPEPFAIVDTAQKFLSFYCDVLLLHGAKYLEKAWGMNRSESEALIRKYLGLCLDTCHFAVQLDDLEFSLKNFQNKEIPIGKIQLSVAPELSDPSKNREGFERLKAFVEPRYFHQCGLKLKDCREVGAAFYPDLEEGLTAKELPEASFLRTHFHVPIFWDGDAALSTTRRELEKAFPLLAAACDHLEIETYTWDVIPAEERKRLAPDLISSIEREYRWVLAQLASRKSV